MVDLATGQVEHTIVTGKAPEHFDVTPDGRRAFVGNMEDSTVSVIDVHEGREIQRITGFFAPHGFSVLPDGSKVYVSSHGAHEVAVLDAHSGRMLKRLAVGDVSRVAARDPQRYLSELKGIANPTLTQDGAFAYAADSDAGVVAIIDTRTDKIVKTLKVGEQPVARLQLAGRPLDAGAQQWRLDRLCDRHSEPEDCGPTQRRGRNDGDQLCARGAARHTSSAGAIRRSTCLT